MVKLIAFGVVTLLLTGLLAQQLGAFALGGGTTYRARFTDVTGVLPGDDVRIAGVRVGRVTGIRVVQNTLAELSFTVDSAVPVPASVQVAVRYRNLVGQRYLALSEGPGTAGPSRALRPGALIPLAQTAPALDLTELFQGFRPLFTALSPQQVNDLSFEIVQVLQGDGGTIADLLAHTASLTSALAGRDQVIARVIDNLNTVLSTLDNRRDELAGVIDSLQQLVSGLAADRTAIGGAVTNLSDLTSATAGLLRDARPDLATDLTQLTSLAGILAGNSDVIEGTLARLPGRYQALTRTASSGPWFNFFLCDFDGRVAVPGAGAVNPATFSSPQARC
ncbi:MAG: MCE family protein [Micromonosporaceae bacterium]|nr:MCE family protein [Micromonosporaceae bacterium]